MISVQTGELFDLSHTIAAPLLSGALYPWEALETLPAFIEALGGTLDPACFSHPEEGIWIAKNARVAKSALILAPCIVDEDAELRHCAFIRGSVIVGKNAVVGNSCELKNAILFDCAQVPHFNYCGDSILGYHAHMGAGAITSNVKGDRTPVVIRCGEQRMETGRKKLGAMLGDFAEIGCNTVLNPGTVIGRGTRVYPLSSVRGVVPAGQIYKNAGEIVPEDLMRERLN